MQDAAGYLYYRRYQLITANAPMPHSAQETMYHALSLLLQRYGEVMHQQTTIDTGTMPKIDRVWFFKHMDK